jgi:hypothetical protein
MPCPTTSSEDLDLVDRSHRTWTGPDAVRWSWLWKSVTLIPKPLNLTLNKFGSSHSKSSYLLLATKTSNTTYQLHSMIAENLHCGLKVLPWPVWYKKWCQTSLSEQRVRQHEVGSWSKTSASALGNKLRLGRSHTGCTYNVQDILHTCQWGLMASIAVVDYDNCQFFSKFTLPEHGAQSADLLVYEFSPQRLWILTPKFFPTFSNRTTLWDWWDDTMYSIISMPEYNLTKPSITSAVDTAKEPSSEYMNHQTHQNSRIM